MRRGVRMEKILECRVCQEDLAYVEVNKEQWAVYVFCPICGSQTAFEEFSNDEEKEEATKKAIHLWNMGKIIAERRSE